jgi:hypothetical protein
MINIQPVLMILIILLVSGCGSAPYLKTHDLVGACNVGNMPGNPEDGYLEPALYAACYTYLAASVDAVYAGAADSKEESSLPAVCIPKRPKVDKIREIFMGYLRDNPERAAALENETPYLAVVEALSWAYPCTEENDQVFRDVATIQGSKRNIDGAQQICIVESIDGRTNLYSYKTESVHNKLISSFYINPGLRKLRVRCEIWRNTTQVQQNSGPISFVAEPEKYYEPVHLPKVNKPSLQCLYIRNIETHELVASTCP